MSKKSFKKDMFSISNEDESLLMPSKKEKVIEPVATISAPLFSVHVDHPNLRKRSGPSMDCEILGYITDMGVYDIFDQRDGWGKLADNCWINLDYASEIKK